MRFSRRAFSLVEVMIVIVIIGQIHWSELPARAFAWLGTHWRKLRLFAWAALFVAVLVYF